MAESTKLVKKIPVVKKLYRSIRKRLVRHQLKKMDTGEVFTDIYKNNTWRGSESISGRGSEGEQVQVITEALPGLLKQFEITSVLDIPCGDFYWMKDVDLGDISYLGADIVTELVDSNIANHSSDKVRFMHLNLLADNMPEVDLIFCRDCLVHFSFADVFSALENVCRSEARYFLTTTFTNRHRNREIVTGQWRTLNLQTAPFNLPEPIAIINEGCTEDGDTFSGKSLALWEMSAIRQTLAENS